MSCAYITRHTLSRAWRARTLCHACKRRTYLGTYAPCRPGEGACKRVHAWTTQRSQVATGSSHVASRRISRRLASLRLASSRLVSPVWCGGVDAVAWSSEVWRGAMPMRQTVTRCSMARGQGRWGLGAGTEPLLARLVSCHAASCCTCRVSCGYGARRWAELMPDMCGLVRCGAGEVGSGLRWNWMGMEVWAPCFASFASPCLTSSHVTNVLGCPELFVVSGDGAWERVLSGQCGAPQLTCARGAHRAHLPCTSEVDG